MTAFDRDVAVRCFDENHLSKEGDEVARYWLSLWRGDQLPRRADFEPKKIAPHLRAVALFEVIPGKSVRCRLQGSGLAEALGQDITGRDWLELTKPEDRPVRLERFSGIARGAIGRGLRTGYRESGESQVSEEVMLPFGDIAPDDSRQVLIHISWRPSAYNPLRTGVSSVGGLSIEFRLFPLAA